MAFTYRRSLTIDHTQCGGSNDVSFPVLVRVSDATMKDVAHSGHVQNSGGSDIIFYSDSTGTTQIASEIDFYDNVNGVLWAWVQVATVSSSVDTTFYVLYGNSSPPSRTTNPWDSHFKGVYHFGDGTTLSTNDSTSNVNHLSTLIGPPTAVAGQIAGAISCGGSANSSNVATAVTDNWTMSFWCNPNTTTSQGIVYNGSNLGIDGWGVSQTSIPNQYTIRFSTGGGGTSQFTGINVVASAWVFIVMQRVSGTTTIYANNSAGGTTSAGVPNAPTAGGVYVGTIPTHGSYDGLIDEFHISDSVRSLDWLTKEFNNQKASSTFLTVGAEREISPSYAFSRSVTVDHTKVPSNQTNFTVALILTASGVGVVSNLKSVANGGVIQNSTTFNGKTVPADLVLTTDSGGTSFLNWDVEYWDPTTGAIVIHVLIPSLSSTVNTVFYLLAGDSVTTTYQGGAVGAAYDSNYKRVYHLAENAANTTVKDATGTTDGISVNNTSSMSGTGQVGPDFAFNGSTDFINIGNITTSGATAAWTVSAWVKTMQTDCAIFGLRNSGNSNPIIDLVLGDNGVNNSGTGKPSVIVRDDGGAGLQNVNSSGSALNDGNWHYVVATRDSSKNLTLYADGNSVGTATDTMTAAQTLNECFLATEPENGAIPTLSGSLDESRLSFTNRSADWVKTKYNNQSSPGTFITLSSTSGPAPFVAECAVTIFRIKRVPLF